MEAPDIQRLGAGRVKGEVVQPGDQLERGAGNIAARRIVDDDVAGRRNSLSRLGRHHAGNLHRAALYGVTRPRAARKQAAPDEELVETEPAGILEFRIHLAFLTKARNKRKRCQNVMMREALHMRASGLSTSVVSRAVSMPIEPVIIRS